MLSCFSYESARAFCSVVFCPVLSCSLRFSSLLFFSSLLVVFVVSYSTTAMESKRESKRVHTDIDAGANENACREGMQLPDAMLQILPVEDVWYTILYTCELDDFARLRQTCRSLRVNLRLMDWMAHHLSVSSALRLWECYDNSTCQRSFGSFCSETTRYSPDYLKKIIDGRREAEFVGFQAMRSVALFIATILFTHINTWTTRNVRTRAPIDHERETEAEENVIVVLQMLFDFSIVDAVCCRMGPPMRNRAYRFLVHQLGVNASRMVTLLSSNSNAPPERYVSREMLDYCRSVSPRGADWDHLYRKTWRGCVYLRYVLRDPSVILPQIRSDRLWSDLDAFVADLPSLLPGRMRIEDVLSYRQLILSHAVERKNHEELAYCRDHFPRRFVARFVLDDMIQCIRHRNIQYRVESYQYLDVVVTILRRGFRKHTLCHFLFAMPFNYFWPTGRVLCLSDISYVCYRLFGAEQLLHHARKDNWLTPYLTSPFCIVWSMMLNNGEFASTAALSQIREFCDNLPDQLLYTPFPTWNDDVVGRVYAETICRRIARQPFGVSFPPHEPWCYAYEQIWAMLYKPDLALWTNFGAYCHSIKYVYQHRRCFSLFVQYLALFADVQPEAYTEIYGGNSRSVYAHYLQLRRLHQPVPTRIMTLVCMFVNQVNMLAEDCYSQAWRLHNRYVHDDHYWSCRYGNTMLANKCREDYSIMPEDITTSSLAQPMRLCFRALDLLPRRLLRVSIPDVIQRARYVCRNYDRLEYALYEEEPLTYEHAEEYCQFLEQQKTSILDVYSAPLERRFTMRALLYMAKRLPWLAPIYCKRVCSTAHVIVQTLWVFGCSTSPEQAAALVRVLQTSTATNLPTPYIEMLRMAAEHLARKVDLSQSCSPP